MVAYLDMPSVANRPINGYDAIAARSDDHPVGQQRGVDRDRDRRLVGAEGARGPGRDAAASSRCCRSGARRTSPPPTRRGSSTASTATSPRCHRAYGMHLLASITPSQRWGIGEVTPRGWTPYFKGGWGSGTGLLDHQVVLLKRGCARVSIAVLTMYDGSHAYGKDTLKGIFERLLRGSRRACARGTGASGPRRSRTGEHRARRLSGRPDSNRGPPPPKGGALPGCATPREVGRVYPQPPRRRRPGARRPPRHRPQPVE